jgi:hypothetical protein
VGILTNQDPDTPEGLESRLSIGIHRILAELPHSTELELPCSSYSKEEYGGIYRGVMLVLSPKVGFRGPTSHTGRPSFVAAPTLGIGYLVHRPSLTHWQSRI